MFCAAIWRDSVFLLRFSFLGYIHVFLCDMSLKTSIELFFFPFLFSVYCRSVSPYVVSIVSGGCNQLLYVIIFYTAFVCNYFFTPSEFFTSVITGDFFLGSNKQQVSLALQDSPMYSCNEPSQFLATLLRLQNAPTASLSRGKTSSTSVLDMTLSNLMVRFQ